MSDTPQGPTRPTRAASRPAGLTRVAALLVLIPTLPMLLASLAALILFYVAPTRFGRVLDRLPGEEIIRSVLAFAPATLLAIVVLAVLYALERPGPPTVVPAAPARAPRRLMAPPLLAISLPLLLAASAAWVARWIAPGRFDLLLEPLPGTTVLQGLVSWAPPLLLAVNLAVVVRMLLSPAGEPARVPPSWPSVVQRLVRLGAALILLPSAPLLLLSLGALLYSFGSPERLAGLVDKLSQPTLIRLGLTFVPLTLLALVLMAALALLAAPARRVAVEALVPAPAPAPGSARQTLAVVVLVGGLMLTVVAGAGLIASLIWLLAR